MAERIDIAAAKADIEATDDLLERALKLSGLVSSLFRAHGVALVVVGGSAVEFYTEGGYMSGDIDFCRSTLKGVSPRLAKDLLAPLGGRCIGRNWVVCGLHLDFLGIVESETAKDFRVQETPYGDVKMIPPELALVERVFYATESSECVASARQMMSAALADEEFDWAEAERIAAHPDFTVSGEFAALKREMEARG